MVKQNFIHILFESHEVRLSKSRQLILLIGSLSHEHIVNGEPDLAFQLCDSSLLVSFDLLPLIVLEFLLNTLNIGSEPRSKFK